MDHSSRIATLEAKADELTERAGQATSPVIQQGLLAQALALRTQAAHLISNPGELTHDDSSASFTQCIFMLCNA